MIAKAIKDILEPQLAEQLEAALKGKGKDGADIDLVAGNDGSYIPRETHELATQQAVQLEGALQTVAASLKDLGATGDTKNLAADVLKVKNDFDALQSGKDAEMLKLRKETALKLGLGNTVYDPGDVIARLDIDKLELDDKGAIKGDLAEFLKPIRETVPHYFKPDTAESDVKLAGAVPGQMSGGGAGDNTDVQLLNAAFELKGDK